MRVKSLVSSLSAVGTPKLIGPVIQGAYLIAVAAWMSKDQMGVYAYALAVGNIATMILAFGTGPIVVRRIAGRAAPLQKVAGAVLLQRLAFPAMGLAVAAPLLWVFREQIPHADMVLVGYGTAAFSAFALVYQQILISNEKYWAASVADILDLLTKVAIGVVLVLSGMGATGLFLALVLGHVVGMVLAGQQARRLADRWLYPALHLDEMRELLKEGLPLLASTIFSQALARFDWVMMGAVRTEAETGEYSFAYRMFEMGWLPHAILGTILLPKFSAAFRERISPHQKHRIGSLHRVMVVVAALLPLAMVCGWTPVMDFFTKGKYGHSNQHVVEILALVSPFAAGVNMLWTLAMARKRTVGVLIINIVCATVNVGANLVLIPRFGGIGAAWATTAAMTLQYLGYVVLMRDCYDWFRSLRGLLVVEGIAIGAVLGVRLLGLHWALTTAIVLGGYAVAAYLARCVATKDLGILLAGAPAPAGQAPEAIDDLQESKLND